ncbi:MAG: 2-C-methyl-D-erythritol 4-phosphate cytidylyltransferase [Phycisphaerales bacterium]|nr:2-C-methyl-D-erythritol 4-phosphate cytidylyltransferase [Phycisphaerae bacterium]NNF42188.1 2-C-methyl-D-erythritol 4-phosphate cytidylyltransferase [Phycisphaerales bacterium]NNM27218.1 2-C-methyl-D-erythritol 4-phosphate cytidylyltransferase [Phycisphaerales bacterium]
MSGDMNACVIIPAAGRSERFGASDKLGQDLGGRPLLLRTVELFARRDEVRTIFVAGPPDPAAFQDFRERYAATLGFHGATVVPGGTAARWETVRAVLPEVPADATHVAVHDAARPGASKTLLDRVFEAARTFDAVVPGLAVDDTVKRVGATADEADPDADDALADAILGEAGRARIHAWPVVETVDRADLMLVQTPQIFATSLLRRAYEQSNLDGVTDDASLVERLGEPVHVVEGEVSNFKITTPADLTLMRAVLGLKAPAERPVHKRF